ncbi:MAG: hypothetical protein QOF60_374 [Actinomycetota bacterium]|nr:hypothetical protein [Actinomycetota bacterium]
MPSVRGRERFLVVVLLSSTAALTGALAGFFAGVAWSVAGGGVVTVAACVVAVVGTLVLDVSRLPPVSVRRQVPQAWGRLFGPPTVAVLYGARLGVGPLTILRTWLWWAALIVGASAGVWWSVAVGALFGLSRVVVMLVAGTRAGRWQGRPEVFAAVVSAALVLLLLLASRQQPSLGNGFVTESTTTTTTTIAPAVVADVGLGGALPDEVLAGWERVPDSPGRHLGPLDLQAAAAAEKDEPAERSLLETRHFLRGQARAWSASGGRTAYAAVYEFASPADATAYLGDGLLTIEARGARVYDVPDIAGAHGFSQAGDGEKSDSASVVSHGLVFVRGPRFYLVFVSGPSSSVTPDDARSVAAAVVLASGSID